MDALGIVSSFAEPLQDVDVNVVPEMLPAPEMVIVFVPSELCVTVVDADTAVTQASSVIVIVLEVVVLVPSIVIENEPVPYVVNPVLFRLY